MDDSQILSDSQLKKELKNFKPVYKPTLKTNPIVNTVASSEFASQNIKKKNWDAIQPFNIGRHKGFRS